MAGRGSFGEISLEKILSDHMPPDVYGIRTAVLGKVPDAQRLSTVGTICIDSKFPQVNYRKMVETGRLEDTEKAKKLFLQDVEGHLTKVAEDYVCAEIGSAEFAFAYIPREAVYWFLASNAFDLFHDFAKKGVQVVSSLTLAHRMELIKAGVYAKKLSEEPQKVQKEILTLGSHFKDIGEMWSTLYDRHLAYLKGKEDELDSALKLLQEQFGEIQSISAG